MSDLIPWYLVELKSRLAPYLSKDQTAEVAKETESHLRESAFKLAANRGLNEEEATSAALMAFGTPERVARTYLREHPWLPRGIRPIYLVIFGAFLSTLAWVLHWQWLGGTFDNMGEVWQNIVAGTAGIIGFALFGLGCYAGRRSFRLPIIALGATMSALAVLTISFLIVAETPSRDGVTRYHFDHDVKQIKMALTQYDLLENYVREGAAAFASAKSLADIPAQYSDRKEAQKVIGNLAWLLPNSSDTSQHLVQPVQGAIQAGAVFITPLDEIYAFTHGSVYGFETGDFTRAAFWWRTRKDSALRSIESGRLNFRNLIASAEAGKTRVFTFSFAAYGEALASTVIFTLGLLVVDGLILAGANRRRVRPELIRA